LDLEVNTLKPNNIIIRKCGRFKHDECWTYNNEDIEIADNFNNLECFNYTGTFVLNKEILTGKGLKALNVLMYNIKVLNLKPSIICHLFDAFGATTLNKVCEICGSG
jgi:hypothetical protein